MGERIGNTVNHSFNLILLYYAIDDRESFDESDGYSIQDIKYLVDHFMQSLDAKKFSFILVGNKLDCADDGDRKVKLLDGKNLSKEWNDMPFVEVSALNGTNCRQLLDLICKQHPKLKKQSVAKQEVKEQSIERKYSRRRLTLTDNTFSYVESNDRMSFIGSLMGTKGKSSFWNKQLKSPKDDGDAFFKSFKNKKVASPKSPKVVSPKTPKETEKKRRVK